ncbi:cell division cycle 20.5, cofactor of APC complex-like [Dorcoceras hygrometricum]|uniref:Cell division cycle 20.5, cofactor of APC complex-like n=1 Tax=Dorcoceras hygrometricum TaxID=472368 RepID=A0A2Z7BKR1_9LAMI|nr:cell division cycle 20.5, cofactor of APC complex-like [Dorcoceras hygrometricum]
MDNVCDWRLQSDWYSPTRLHDSPVEYDFPIAYRKKLEDLTLDVEGRPFKMLVFRGSPKSSRTTQSPHMIDEMRSSDENILDHKPLRQFPKHESRILDAPNIKNDYYLNVMDWGKTNVLAVALGTRLYQWNVASSEVSLISKANIDDDYPASVAWSEDAKSIATGYRSSTIELYDAETLKRVRCLKGHRRRVGCITWNSHILTSGSCDRSIINHDVRAKNSLICNMKVHTHEVCGLKWSVTGNILASGGNDNVLYIWNACKMSSMHYVNRFNSHCAAVKALAWCPYNYDLLASGGGTNDGTLKLWNVQKGGTTSCDIPYHLPVPSLLLRYYSINLVLWVLSEQICGLIWNSHHKEILSGHGYGTECQNQICLWSYPSMSKIGQSTSHASRVLHLSQSPDGLTAVSAGADETLRFWEVFGPAQSTNSDVSYLKSLLSFKTSPMR